MKKLKLLAVLLSVVALTFSSCKKDEEPQEPEEPTSSETTYILGTYNTESFLMTNGQVHYFDRTDNKAFAALDMAVSDNGDVYVVGELNRPGVSTPPISVLYKNNVECSEYTFDFATFCGISLKENGDIVLAGLYNGKPAVWDGTTRTELPTPREDVLEWDVASIEYRNGNEIIVGTYMVDDTLHYTPILWVNRELTRTDPKDNASVFAFSGTFTNGANYAMGGINIYPDHSKAFELNNNHGDFTEIPYQWEGSNASMIYGVVNSFKWNDPSRSIYSLVTEYYIHGYINPITKEIGAVDSINGGFYLVKNGQVMPETKFKYPKDNTLASIIDMSMNSKGEIVLVGTLFDMECMGVRPAYWVNGQCHIINPDRMYDDGVASRVIIKSTKK